MKKVIATELNNTPSIRDLEIQLRNIDESLQTIQKQIQIRLDSPTEDLHDFFQETSKLVVKEKSLKQRKALLEDKRTEKVNTLVQDFFTLKSEQDRTLYVDILRRELDPEKKESLFNKALKSVKHQKAEKVYSAILNFEDGFRSEASIHRLITACSKFEEEVKSKSKTSAKLAFISSLKASLKHESIRDVMSREASIKFKPSHTQALQAQNRGSRAIKRASRETIQNIFSASISGELNEYSSYDIALKLKKELLLWYANSGTDLDTQTKLELLLTNEFNCISRDFTESIEDLHIPFVQAESKQPIIVRKDTFLQRTYTLGDYIGGGATGKVYKTTEENSPEPLVAKIVYTAMLGEEEGLSIQPLNNTIKEVRNIKQLDLINTYPEHLVEYKDIFILVTEYGPSVVFIMEELSETGDAIIHNLENAPFNERRTETWQMLNDCAKGLLEMRNKGLLHRDIKAGNIAKKNNKWKLLDFGSSEKEHHHSEGSKFHRGPEYFKGKYTSALDVFSLGVVAFQMLLGNTQTAPAIHIHPDPIDDTLLIDPRENTFNLKQLEIAFSDPTFNNLTETERQFLMRLLDPKPQNRPSLEDIINY